MRSGYATCFSPRPQRCSRRLSARRLTQPRKLMHPSRGRRCPRQSARTTCRCSFRRNRSRPATTLSTTKPVTMLTTPTWPTTTMRSRPIGLPRAGGVVAVEVVAGDTATRRPTAAIPTRPNGRPTTPPNPRTPKSQTRPTPKTAIPTITATMRTTRGRALPSAAVGAGAASPARATTRTVRRPTIRPTPWCTSGRRAPANPVGAPMATPATESKASMALPAWRPSGNAAGTGATPDGAAPRY